MKIISWNLLRETGATVDEVVELVSRERPDFLLLQEATEPFAHLCDHVGGHYSWHRQPGRVHGLAMWSPAPWTTPPSYSKLTPGAWFQRISQTVTVGPVGIANVHLSHGQRLNRRQLREIAARLPPNAAVLGDFNLVGPALLPGFRDVGPRWPTHRMLDILPLRIDRCMVRGLSCKVAHVLPRRRSDHRPICVTLSLAEVQNTRRMLFRYRAAAAEDPRLEAERGHSVPRDRASATSYAGRSE